MKHKINVHGLKSIKSTGSEAYIQLSDNNGGPIDVKIKVISDDDDSKG